ncbi:flagellar protein FliT [Sulfurivermis fontis]|uniref:flagellar protein FliT n=1 Tax=Sulfurivermis fontis TaxID=1972068 RepID=UPI000FD6DB09|nr:flagellar protein FliT [Sulfurivermis fontis]
MSNHSRQQQWEAIVAQSRRMQALAREGQWDEVAVLEVQRRSEMEAFFQRQVSADEAVFVAEGIREVMELDRETMVRCAAARDEAGKQAGVMQQGRRAEAAYNSNR